MPWLRLRPLEEADGAWSQAVLEAFAKRWTGEVPKAPLDAEVERAWARTSGTEKVRHRDVTHHVNRDE